MVKNTKLKESMQLLAQSTLSLYKEEIPIDERFPNDRPHIYIALMKLDQRVTENPGFITCANLMENDKNIKALQGQLVGTDTSKIIVENEKACILSFLQQLYVKSPEYEQDLFDQEYASFEDLFYSDTLGLIDSARLYNFQFCADKIELGKGIIIRKVTKPDVPQEDHIERMYSPYVVFSQSNFVIERKYNRVKRVGDRTRPDLNEIKEEFSQTANVFDLVITALRILKPSAVYRDHRISSELITFHPHRGTSTSIPFFTNIAIGEKCEIKKEDVAELKVIFTHLINEQISRFIVAQRRLSLGIERKELEDRLIDYMIGLEALYLPDGNQELSFRLSLRLALLLHPEPAERKKTYYFVREMYNARSEIVHGSKRYDLNVDEIGKLEELLRRSLKLWIYDRRSFSVNKFSNSGILKSEGKLDKLFFTS